MEKAFSRCMPRTKRRQLASDYPRPDTPATTTPKLEMVFRSALRKTTTDHSDEQLVIAQSAVLAQALL